METMACTGAAAFAAMTAYEHKRANEGEPVSHAHAKQALAALAGFEVGVYFSPVVQNYHSGKLLASVCRMKHGFCTERKSLSQIHGMMQIVCQRLRAWMSTPSTRPSSMQVTLKY